MRGEIKYSYCLDENNNLVHIKSIVANEVSKHHYVCIECGNEMHPRIGKIKSPHFAHNPGVSCHGESYLHKLAKRKFKEHFDSSGKFRLLQSHEVSCENKDNCAFYGNYKCFHNNSRRHNLKEFYDTCKEEVPIKGFVADLLISKSDKKDREPVLIEVLVTHACEKRKIESGLKIIETMNIEYESDIDDIIRNGFIEGKNCKLHNFKPLPRMELKKRPIDRFILHASGGATTQTIYCKDVNVRIEKDSIAELNVNSDKLLNYLHSFYDRAFLMVGLIYLKRKGVDVRNCLLCKFYCLHHYYYTSICKLYKKYGTPKSPKQTSAMKCQYFSVSYDVINKIDSELLNDVVKELR